MRRVLVVTCGDQRCQRLLCNRPRLGTTIKESLRPRMELFRAAKQAGASAVKLRSEINRTLLHQSDV